MYLKRLSGIPVQHHPVAAFQATGNGTFGGVMHIQPGGKNSVSKGVNLGTPSNSNLGRGASGAGHIDQGTRVSLVQLQQRTAPVIAASGAALLSSSSNVLSPGSTQYSPPVETLKRLSSAELDNWMIAAHEDSLARQQLGNLPVLRDDLGLLPGLGNLRMGESLNVLTGLADLRGRDMVGTLPDFLPLKEEQEELAPLASVTDFGMDRYRDFGSPSPFSTVSSTLSGGVGSDSSFGTYSEFASATVDFVASPQQEVVPPFLDDLIQPEASRSMPLYRPQHRQG